MIETRRFTGPYVMERATKMDVEWGTRDGRRIYELDCSKGWRSYGALLLTGYAR